MIKLYAAAITSVFDSDTDIKFIRAHNEVDVLYQLYEEYFDGVVEANREDAVSFIYDTFYDAEYIIGIKEVPLIL